MSRLLLVATIVIVHHGTALARAQPVARTPLVEMAGALEAVTVYRGRASVTRRAELDRPAGLYDLRFSGLPETIQVQTLQASVNGPARVLGVQYEQREAGVASSPKVAALDEQIEATELALARLADEREVIQGQVDFIDALTIRATSDAAATAGTEAMDLDAVGKQLAFVTEERMRIVGERRVVEISETSQQEELRRLQAERDAIAGRGLVDRAAIVTIALHQAQPISVELVYLVGDATWVPAYNIRAAEDGSSVMIEYDAFLAQRTGEDWTDVRLTLSTAQPAVAANPPTLSPWYVDLLAPPRPGFGGGGSRAVPSAAAASPEADAVAAFGLPMEELKALSADAGVSGAGPSVTYELPRAVTVRSHAEQQQRTRIAAIDASPDFNHVAVPVLTDAVYVRGTLMNASPFQLLSGAASIFAGSDYVGPTRLGAVPPGGRFDLYFGIDPAVTAKRQLVTRNTAKTGLLGGGRKTSDAYRITISNGAGKSIALELWDRRPVSRTDLVEIEVIDLSHALATDAIYVEEDAPRGLLKWYLSVPPDPPSGDPAATVTFGVNVARAKDVEITPLPR